MSFREKYIVRRNERHLGLAVLLYFISGSVMVLFASDPGMTEAAKTVAGLNPSELLALITLSSLAFSAWILKGMDKNIQKLINQLHDRPCFYKSKEKNDESI